MFGGTVRSAIDPNGQFEDKTLSDALHRAFTQVTSVADGGKSSSDAPEALSRCFDLDRPVEPGGANLSLGERSLLSLARVLIRNSQIVILDEAMYDFLLSSSEGSAHSQHYAGPPSTIRLMRWCREPYRGNSAAEP